MDRGDAPPPTATPWLVLAAIAATLAGAPAQDEKTPPGEPTSRIASALTLARTDFDGGRLDAARTSLIAALASLDERDTDPTALDQTAELLARCAFALDYGTPSAREIFGDGLNTWNEQSGKIELRLGPELPGFIEAPGGLRVLPVPFAGAHRITLRGPATGRLRIELQEVGDVSFEITIPLAGGSLQVVEIGAAGRETLHSVDVRELGIAGSYDLELMVGRRTCELKANGKRALQFAKPRNRYGRLGIAASAPAGSIEIVGQLDRDRITDFAAMHRRAAEAAFEWRPEPDVPAWFAQWRIRRLLVAARVEPPARARQAARAELERLLTAKEFATALEFVKALPDVTLPAAERAVFEARVWQGRDDFARAFRVLERANAGGIPVRSGVRSLRRAFVARLNEHYRERRHRQVLRLVADLPDDHRTFDVIWVEGLSRVALHDHRGALPLLETAARLRPKGRNVHPAHAQCLVRLHRLGDAIEAYGRAVKLVPADERSHRWIAYLHLLRGDKPAAADALARAEAAGIAPAALASIVQQVQRASQPPPEAAVHTAASAAFEVATDVSPAVAERTLAALDESLAIAEVLVREVGSGETFTPIRVTVLAEKAAFMRYHARVLVGPPVSSTGTYDYVAGHMIVHWRETRPEVSLQTVRHEGVHVYLHRLLPLVPDWLDEGMACHLEGFRLAAGRPAAAGVRSTRYAVLDDGDHDWLPVPALLALEGRAFYRPDHKARNYACSLAVVDYLMTGGPKARALLAAVLDDLASGLPENVANERLLERAGGGDAFDAAVRAHYERGRRAR